MRDTSMWIYILHPLFIVALRGGARIIGLADQLAQNSIIFFFLVFGLSLAGASLIGMRAKIINPCDIKGFMLHYGCRLNKNKELKP